MRVPKELIERKLSAALGARVTIEQVSVSLLGGSLEVNGVTVTAHGASDAILTVRRVEAAISLGAMLRKEVVIKSVVIEGPRVSVVRAADGTMNLPKREAGRSPAPPRPTPDEPEDDTPSAWKLATEKVRLLDGAAHFHGDGGYHVSAERIVGELLQKPDGIHVTVLAASLGRRDDIIDLGEARAHFVFRASDIAKLTDSPAEGTFAVGDVLRGSVSSVALSERRAEVDLHANLALSMLRTLLPPSLVPKVRLDGQGSAHIVASLDAKEGLRIKRLSVNAADVTARPARGGGGDASSPT